MTSIGPCRSSAAAAGQPAFSQGYLTESLREQVPLPQDLGVMRDVPHRKIRKRPHREWVVTCGSAPRPCLRWKGSKEGQRRGSDRPELLRETTPRAIIRARCGHRDRLIKTGQWALKSACKPEGAKHKQALRVIEVVHDITDAPFAWSVAVQRFLLRDAEQQVEHLVSLSIQKSANVAFRDLIDICEIV